MNRQDILGPWKLVSVAGTSQEGQILYPFGETPVGMIMYDPSGYMSYTAMRAHRPKFATDDIGGGTPEEIQAAFEGFDAYCGTYNLDIENGVVTHHVEASRFPNWEGSDQVRFFQLAGDRLIIDTAAIQALGSEWVLHVVFERPEGYSASGARSRSQSR